MPEYLSVKEAAEKLDLTPAAVRALIQKGALEGAFQTPNRAWVIPAEAVSAYKADQKEAPRKPRKPAAKPPRETTKKEKEEKKRPPREKKETKPARRRKKSSSGIGLDDILKLIMDRMGKSEQGQSGGLLGTLLGQLAGSGAQRLAAEPAQLKTLLTGLAQQNPDLLQEVLQSASAPDLTTLLDRLDLKNE